MLPNFNRGDKKSEGAMQSDEQANKKFQRLAGPAATTKL
jgi:hypothetical protein